MRFDVDVGALFIVRSHEARMKENSDMLNPVSRNVIRKSPRRAFLAPKARSTCNAD